MLKTAMIFNNNMVLQRGDNVAVWGVSDPYAEIKIEIQGQTISTKADSNGLWKDTIPCLHESFHETMIISNGVEQIKLEGIMVGEVWIAGGQSNMEFHMRYDKNMKRELEICNNDAIRFFDYPKVQYEGELEKRDYSDFGFWRTCDVENLQFYSAAGYYFAKKLQKELQVPIGIIGCNWGGTKACCWMDEEYLEEYALIWKEEYEQGLKAMGDVREKELLFINDPQSDRTKPFENTINDKLMFGVTEEEMAEFISQLPKLMKNMIHITPVHPWRPSGLFHTMVEKIIPYTVNGVIWYQGESDETYAKEYKSVMTGVINCWRSYWDKNLPFIMTELAPLAVAGNGLGSGFVEIRKQQEMVASQIKDVYCASIGDAGMEGDIHPKDKEPVGNRMALLALGHIYKKDIQCEAPIIKTSCRKMNKIVLEFNNVNEFHLIGSKINGLKMYHGEELIPEYEYDVKYSENKLYITLEESRKKHCIRISYISEGYYVANLYNEENNPCKPFEIII